MAAFTIAIGAATSGMDVTMFFTFWGLNVLKKKKMIRGKSFKQKMMNVMNNLDADSLPLSKFNMLGTGPVMMKSLMKDSNFPQIKELMKTAKELKVKFIACTTSIAMMGLTKEDFISVDDYAGVATYLNIAKDSKLNLFIS